jgi:hypothetical protein
MPDPIRNRIKSHRRIRAGDLVPHEWNFRLHPELQKLALQALYREVGAARAEKADPCLGARWLGDRASRTWRTSLIPDHRLIS